MAFSAQITADISNFESNLSKAGKSVDDFSKKVGDQLNKVGDSFIKAGKTASVFSGVVAGVAAGIGALAISTANYTKDLDSLSTITGITTDMLQEYQLIALKATVPTDAIAQATMALTRRLKDVSEEGAGAAETLRNLGVSLKDANGKMKTAGQVSEDAIMALAGLEKGVETNALGVSIFGRQWNDVIQIVDLGADEIAKLKGEAHDLGLVLSKDAITGSANFGIEVDVLKLRLKALKDQIGTELAPMLTNTLMPIIEEKIVPAFEKATKKIKFLVEQFDDLSPKTKNLIIAITGLTVAIGPVVLALGGIIKLLPLITTGFAALFSPVTAIITAVGLLSYGLYKIIKPLVETEIGVKAVKDATKDLHRELAIEQREIDKLFIAYKNANPATEEHRKIKAEIIANYGQYLKGQIDERGNIIDIDGAYTQLNSSLRDHIALKIKNQKLEAIDIKNINAQAEAISKLTAKVADADKMKFGARLNEELRSFSNSAEKDIGKLMDTLASVTRDEFGVGLFDTSGLFDKNAYDAIRNLVNVMRDAESQTQALNIAFAGVEGASVFDKVATSVDGVSNSLDTLSKKDIIPAGSLKELTKKLEDLYTQLDEATTQSGRLKIAKLISDVEGKVARIKVKVDLEIQGKGSLEPITEKDIINIDRDSLIEKARQTLGALKPIIIEAKAETASLLLDWGSVIGSGLTGIMQGLGEALASGGNVMGNIGKTIIKTLGGLAQQVGSMMIAFGVAALNLYTLMANPVGAIIAGAALVALGSLAVAAVSGAMNKGLSGGGSSGTDAGAGAKTNPATNFPRGEFQLAGAYSEEVEFRISGDSLVGILKKKENRANRLG